jgi:DNA-binding CsgD family transcriptional regulator
LAAAQAKLQAGAFGPALELLGMAEAGPLSELQRARLDMVRAQLAFVAHRGKDAAPLLLKAARRLEPIDAALARMTYLEALSAAIFAGNLASPGGGAAEVARAAGAAPPVYPCRAPDLLLDGLATQHRDGYAAGLPILRRALAEFGVGMSVEEELRWLWLAGLVAVRTWDDEQWEALTARHVRLARETGALSELPLALTWRTSMLLVVGELPGAALLAEETQVVEEATDTILAPYAALGLAALRGDQARTAMLSEQTLGHVSERGQGIGISFTGWANAALHNGLSQHRQALAAAQAGSEEGGSSFWPLVELLEAAARSGMTDAATQAYQRLTEMTGPAGTDWALGVQARSLALLSEGETAEQGYREAISRLGRTRIRTELARAHLVYGEWLRRERRRGDAREQLRTAHRMYEAMGMDAFADRAQRERLATGETARKRTEGIRHTQLTAQEVQIARLARDGLSNPEIGVRLFISARTVQYHLRKIFAKLGINSRTQLDRVLPSTVSPVRPPPSSPDASVVL